MYTTNNIEEIGKVFAYNDNIEEIGSFCINDELPLKQRKLSRVSSLQVIKDKIELQ